MGTHVLSPTYKDESAIWINLYKVGILTDDIEYGKPKWEFTVKAGHNYYDSSLHGDWIAGWGDENEILRSLCSFMSYYSESSETENVHPTLLEIALEHSETFALNSIEPDEDYWGYEG